MATRLDLLITHARSATENQEVSASIGIPDAEFIRYYNEAQDHIVSKIVAQHKSAFAAEVIKSVVGKQESYTLPSDAFIKNKVITAEYSTSGNIIDYYPLSLKTLTERCTWNGGLPDRYIVRNGNLLINPIPDDSRGTLRINYISRPCDLDVRRGQVSAVTLNGTNRTITSLTITSTADNVTILNDGNYVTIVDRLGNIKMKGILLSSTGITGAGPYTVNVDSSFVYESGETITSGDYIVSGAYASTHHQLDDQVERFLNQWVILKIFKRDTSVNDVQLLESEVAILENDIIESYSHSEEDVRTPPVVNYWEV